MHSFPASCGGTHCTVACAQGNAAQHSTQRYTAQRAVHQCTCIAAVPMATRCMHSAHSGTVSMTQHITAGATSPPAQNRSSQATHFLPTHVAPAVRGPCTHEWNDTQ